MHFYSESKCICPLIAIVFLFLFCNSNPAHTCASECVSYPFAAAVPPCDVFMTPMCFYVTPLRHCTVNCRGLSSCITRTQGRFGRWAEPLCASAATSFDQPRYGKEKKRLKSASVTLCLCAGNTFTQYLSLMRN